LNIVEAQFTLLPNDDPTSLIFEYTDLIFTILFTIELAINLFSTLVKSFVKDPWNFFDLTVVAVSLFSLGMPNMPAAGPMRLLRCFRVFRLFKRIKALRGKIGPLGGAFQFIGQAPNLCDTDDLAELRETIVAAQASMMADGRELGVVAIDTLSASVPGADENSAADMSPVLHALQEMARELDLLFLVIAHTGKDEGRGLRGWSGLLANADGVVMLESPDGATRMGSVTKVKDGLSGDRFAFELQRVVLGLDEDGDEITSCIIEEADAPEGPRAGRKPAKASGTAALILSAFDRVLAEKPRPIPAKAPGVPRGVSGVNVNDLRAVAYEIGVGGGPADIPSDASPEERKRNEARWHDQRRKDFKRGLDHLLETQTLRLQDEIVWIAAAKAGVGA
jgi:hypothetical protein